MIPSLHDWLIASYTVECEKRVLRLNAEYRNGAGHGPITKVTSVIFSGVEAYQLDNDAFGNIVLSLDESDPLEIYLANQTLLQESWRWGSPGPWVESSDKALAHFKEHKIRGFELSATIGLSGWVLARTVQCA